MNDYARHEHHDFLGAAGQALADPPLQAALVRLTGTLMAGNRRGFAALADSDALRDHAKRVKEHTLAHLDRYLEQLEASVRRLGKAAGRPLNALDDRMAVVAALGAVDLVVPFDADTPRDLIAASLPEILVKGGDYTAETTAGAAEVVAAGGRFVAIPFRHDRSTTALVERIRR